MAKDEIIKQVPQAWELRPESVPFKPILARWLILVGSPTTAVAVAILSMDWCSTTFHSIWISALSIWLVDEIGPRRIALRRAWGRQVQWIGVLVVVVALGLVFRATPDTVFKRAFGMPPPSGIRNAVVDAHLRLIDTVQLMRFTADEETISRVAAHPKFDRVLETTKGYPQDRSWDDVWRRTFGSAADHGGNAWKNVRPMSRPVHFRREDQSSQEYVDLLWDAETGEAYVKFGTTRPSP